VAELTAFNLTSAQLDILLNERSKSAFIPLIEPPARQLREADLRFTFSASPAGGPLARAIAGVARSQCRTPLHGTLVGTLLVPLAAVSCLTYLGLFLGNLQRTTLRCWNPCSGARSCSDWTLSGAGFDSGGLRTFLQCLGRSLAALELRNVSQPHSVAQMKAKVIEPEKLIGAFKHSRLTKLAPSSSSSSSSRQ